MTGCARQRITPDDIYLSGVHVLFIVFSFAFAVRAPWYWGATMIVVHAAHEKLVGDCILSRIQKRRGYSGPQDDFFFHLFCRLGIPQSRSVTSSIHMAIKTIILFVVVAKLILVLT